MGRRTPQCQVPSQRGGDNVSLGEVEPVEHVGDQLVGNGSETVEVGQIVIERSAQAAARPIEQQTAESVEVGNQRRPVGPARRHSVDEEDRRSLADVQDADLRAEPTQSHDPFDGVQANRRPQSPFHFVISICLHVVSCRGFSAIR